MTTPAAALRASTLSTQVSPFALPNVRTWREQTSVLSAVTDMRNQSALRSLHPIHNSIAANLANAVLPTAVVTPGNAGRGGYGAAKQAAPPRGVPR